MEGLIVNSSLIKHLFFKGNERIVCPHYVKCVYIDKSIVSPQSESMLFGSYFETLAIGSGARGNKTFDLPRKQLTDKQEAANRISTSKGNPPIYYGEKTINQIRIETQASEFKRLCAKYQITIAPPFNTQVLIYKRWDDNVLLSGELDIFPTLVLGTVPKLCVVDLKLTADLNSTFGEFAWGDFDSMDNIQGLMYQYLVRDIDFDLNSQMGNDNLFELVSPTIQKIIDDNELKFLFWVFDYKKPVDKLGNKFFPVNYDSNAECELKETIRKTVSLIDTFESSGWQRKVCKTCEKCPIECSLKSNTYAE